jgi:tRNA dimethylallyltransferase
VPLNERRGIPHHLIDFVSPEVTFTAADWARAAIQTIDEIESSGHLAILVGGTGFYLRALRQPFFPSPVTDENLRQRLTKIRERHGSERLHRILRKFDSVEADKLNPRDWPRVQRAIEFFLQTGERISGQRPLRPSPPEMAARLRILALNPPREELYARINQRTEQHFAAGWLMKCHGFSAKDYQRHSSALGAHGYRRVVEYLKGQRSLESATRADETRRAHYAKRQLTWFRREPGVEWIEGFGDDPQVQTKDYRCSHRSS